MPLSKPLIEIVNVVASATIEQSLDLYKIQKKFPKSKNQIFFGIFKITFSNFQIFILEFSKKNSKKVF